MTDFNIFRPDKEVTGMSQINDGKHFLRLKFEEQHITGDIICEADPTDGECRSPNYDTCAIKESWDNLCNEMISAPAEGTLPAIDFPIKYWTRGYDDDFEDWVEVVGRPRITELNP